MPYLPPTVARTPLHSKLLANGLRLVHRGKVRDTYANPSYPGLLIMVATDRISIFDFVLGVVVPFKGKVLTAMTVFWLTEVFRVHNHLVAAGHEVDAYLPQGLRGDPKLQARTLVVTKAVSTIPVESVVRGYLTGSALTPYRAEGKVCGHQLPPGLHDGSLLRSPIYTPTTKAQTGHDEHMDVAAVRQRFGDEMEALSINLYTEGGEYASRYGVIIADTKFEFGVDSNGRLMLIDEVLTPDSSRFWDAGEYAVAQREQRSPGGHDKEPVRQAGKKVVTEFDGPDGQRIVGINNLDPSNGSHARWVGTWQPPTDLLADTRNRYLSIFHRISGDSLEKYQASTLGIEM